MRLSQRHATSREVRSDRSTDRIVAEFFQIVRDGLMAQVRGKPAGDHISADLLTAFQELRLTGTERGRVMEHLASCDDCREVLALATPPLETPAVQAVQKGWLRAPVLRWGAVAAAFATVLIAIGVHQHRLAPEVGQVVVSRTEPAPHALPAAPEQPPVPPTHAAAEAPTIGAKVKSSASRPKAKHEVQATAGKVARDEIATLQGSITITEYQEFRAQGQDMGTGSIGRLTRQPAPEAPAPPPPQALSAQPFSYSMMRSIPVLTTRSAGSGAAVMQDGTLSSEEPNAPSESPILGGSAPRASSETIFLRKALDLAKRRVIGVPNIRPGTSGALAETGGAPAASIPTAPWGSAVVWRRTVTVTGTAWNITQSGRLLRSLDGGRTWQVMWPDTTSKFRVMCNAGDSVWVGSQDGVLFRSSDSGDHWVRIGSPWGRGSVSATILNIDFSDALHGLLLASNGDTWETFDGGNSWTKR